MHDTLAYSSATRSTASYHHDRSPGRGVRLRRAVRRCRSATTRWCTASGRWSASCPATGGSGWPGCAGCSATCGASPAQEAALHGLRSWPTSAEWSEQRGLDWHAATRTRTSRRVRRPAAATSTGPTASRRRCGRGFRWISVRRRRPATCWRYLRRGDGRLGARLRGQLLRRPRTPGLPDRAAGPPAAGWRCSTPTRTCYGGSGVGNLGAVLADGPPMGDLPASATVQIGPYGVVWLRPRH